MYITAHVIHPQFLNHPTLINWWAPPTCRVLSPPAASGSPSPAPWLSPIWAVFATFVSTVPLVDLRKSAHLRGWEVKMLFWKPEGLASPVTLWYFIKTHYTFIFLNFIFICICLTFVCSDLCAQYLCSCCIRPYHSYCSRTVAVALQINLV